MGKSLGARFFMAHCVVTLTQTAPMKMQAIRVRHCYTQTLYLSSIPFIARDSIICYSAYMLSPVRLSVCLSVTRVDHS